MGLSGHGLVRIGEVILFMDTTLEDSIDILVSGWVGALEPIGLVDVVIGVSRISSAETPFDGIKAGGEFLGSVFSDGQGRWAFYNKFISGQHFINSNTTYSTIRGKSDICCILDVEVVDVFGSEEVSQFLES